MFKKLSVSGLLILSALLPAASFAKESHHALSPSGRTHVESSDEANEGAGEDHADARTVFTGKVTAVSGTTLTLVSSTGTTYTVDVSSAKAVRRFHGSMLATDIQVNDQISVRGRLVGTTITAKSIQDLSLQARNGSFSGTVQSVSTSGFVLQSHDRGLQTVLVSSATKISKNGTTATLSDVMVGAAVKVEGVWDNTNKNVTAAKVQIVVKQEQVRLNGTVSTLSGTTLTLVGSDGKTYFVNVSAAQLATRSYYGNDWTHMHTGDAVQVWGKTMTGSTDVKASIVVDFSAS